MELFDLTPESLEARCGAELRALRAALHRAPETALKEYRTTALLKKTLSELGLELLDTGTETGAAAMLTGALPGPTAALRADIDALPLTEQSGSPDASGTPGLMHACGHDLHAAAALGAAMALLGRRERLPGRVFFLFQPAEETVEGAKRILDGGLLERARVGALFGLHVWPELPFGQIGLCSGAVMAAKDSFRITVAGRSGHGSSPQNALDPIPAGAAVVLALQTIVSRNLAAQEPAVVSVCSVQAGSCDNVIPDRCVILGSVRTFSDAARTLVLTRLSALARGTAEAYGCTAVCEILPGVPAVVNSPALLPAAREAVCALYGPEGCVCPPPVTISEDFARYSARVPTCFALFGVGVPGAPAVPLHSARFYPDSRVLFPAACYLAGAAERWLASQRKT